MTWVLIVLALSIGLAVVVWSLSATRRPPFAVPLVEAPALDRMPSVRPRAVVADLAALRHRLRAALVLLDARRLELRVPGTAGETVLASAGESGEDAGVATRVPVMAETETVAWLHVVRHPAAPPLGEADEQMLGALGASLGDSLGVVREPERDGRFRRRADLGPASAAPRRARP